MLDFLQGFYRCNRWIEQKDHETYGTLKPDAADIAAAKNITDEHLADPTRMELTYGTAMHEARVSRNRTREIGRFLHHYRRWNAHFESATLERKMRDTVCERLAPVMKAATKFSETYNGEFDFGGHGLSFVHAAFTELLECRSTMQHSYAYSYIRFKTQTGNRDKLPSSLRSEKHAVERSQASLETMTEQLSDVVARSHLRATQTQILFLTAATAEKRKEFSNLMITILAKEKGRVQKEESNSNGAFLTFNNENAGRMTTPNDSNVVLSHHDDAELHVPRSDNNDHVIGDDSSKEDIETAIRASLAQFLRNTGELDVLDIDNESTEDADDAHSDWSCFACTFVNAQGPRCAMCGTKRP